MAHCKKFVAWLFPSFSPKHYTCAICGVNSASPDDLCSPVEVEFEQ